MWPVKNVCVPKNGLQGYSWSVRTAPSADLALNIAARIQGLAVSDAIFASKPVIDYPQSSALLQNAGIAPLPQSVALKGVAGEVPVYEIP